MHSYRLQSLVKSNWFILLTLFFLSFIPNFPGLLRLLELIFGLHFLPTNPRAQAMPMPIIYHIVASDVFCILGIFQFLPRVRKKFPIFHRIAGRLLVLVGTVSALSGLWMTHYYTFPQNLQGSLLYFVRLLVGVSMLACLALGVTFILKRKIIQHKIWMIRAYALGQGAATQVLIMLPYMAFINKPEGLARDILMSLAWLVNLAVVEITVNKRRSK